MTQTVTDKILLCMDMDRTALPNGNQEESPHAQDLLRHIAQRPELIIAYVSGRRKELQQNAIREFRLPEPAYSVGDVGTSIYEISDGEWKLLESWQSEIARSWHGRTSDDVKELLAEIPGLRLQDAESQARFKLSYFADSKLDHDQLVQRIRHHLEPHGIHTSIIWSVDETTDTGLLDILPECADKLHAVEFLIKQTGVTRERTVYAGDSGNDLPVLTSGLPAVLVANAIDEVRRRATEEVKARGCSDQLYLARGGFLGMNGNYAAGILEGLAHFVPETQSWMDTSR